MLINTVLGEEEKVAEELRKLKGVKKANEVYGTYDIVVEVEVNGPDELKEVVLGDIRNINGVRSTLTLVVVNEQQ